MVQVVILDGKIYWEEGKFGGQDYCPSEDGIKGGRCDEEREEGQTRVWFWFKWVECGRG